MKRLQRIAVASFCFLLLAGFGSVTADVPSGKPIQALLVTGGCCHDYETQKKLIPTGVSARANVKWTVVHQGGDSTNPQIPLFDGKEWAKGFDVVVYHFCFADIDDPSRVKRVLAPHRKGTPAVFVHCAMHTFRALEEPLWHEATGIRTSSHKSKGPILVKNREPDHFITRPIGREWTTPAGELYEIDGVMDGTKVLATGQQVGAGEQHPSVWTRRYGPAEARVFGMTLGHHNETIASDTFLDVLTRGILWATGHPDEAHIRPAGKKDRQRLQNQVSGGENSQADNPSFDTGKLDVHDDFEKSIFATPPELNYPACMTATPSGYLFVGSDPQGSLGKKSGHGKIVRLADMNGDGRADQITTFAKLDHPRGLVYRNGKLWVLHPPRMTLLEDTDLDGKAEERTTLMKNVSSSYINKRGVDHAVNGMRMGIDGWIYIAVGDFGLENTTGGDGAKIHRRGGGVIRIRPDGSDLEVHSWELRNPYDVAVSPYLDLFTRENTNDGQGWNVRLMHLMQSARYGYPARYSDFPGEIMPPLDQYPAGSGTGALYLHDRRWPDPFGDRLYTADWGTSQVYMHPLARAGPTFRAKQDRFMFVLKPTDLDVDGAGRLYVSSWKNGKFRYKGENVGFIAMLRPNSYTPRPPVTPGELSGRELVRGLTSPSARHRKAYQHELLQREFSRRTLDALVALAGNQENPLYGRVAAIFTLKQMLPSRANGILADLFDHPSLRPFLLRAMTDRREHLSDVPLEPFLTSLQRSDSTLQAQAVIGLGRLKARSKASEVLPFTRRRSGKLPDREPLHAQPDPGRVLPHLAVRSLVNMNAVSTCLDAIGGPYTEGALRALSRIHDPEVVSGLIERLKEVDALDVKKRILTALIRLAHKENSWDGGWWGTTPNPDGPYADPVTWEQSSRIGTVLTSTLSEGSREIRKHVKNELAHHAVDIDRLIDR